MSLPTLSQTELISLLMAKRGAFPVTITAATQPRMRKTGNPYLDAIKIARVNGILNWIYESSVNRQREREEHDEAFVAEPRRWGHRVFRNDGTVTPLVEHNGNYYLELKVQRSLGHQYRVGDKVIPEEELEPFLYQVNDGSTRQEVDRPIILRDYKVDSIRQIVIDNTEYEING